MIELLSLAPGVRLRCFRSDHFKHGCLSVQYLRPMTKQESSLNALLPAALLRGTARCRDLRQITDRLDDLYGASVGALVRRIGDYQTTGFYCSFLNDRYALPGDRVLEGMVDFVRELLFEPLLRDGVFDPDFVESEKRNLISTIESDLNDKRVYASARLMELMCAGDSYGVPRLGTVEGVAEITPQALYDHYQTILEDAPLELFYVGPVCDPPVAKLLPPLLQTRRGAGPLSAHTAFAPVSQPREVTERMNISQARLAMGFLTPVTNTHPLFAAMQVANVVYGGGMTSKLFMNVREKLSLCYSVSSSYFGAKGILTVSAGIETGKYAVAREEILRQLELCRQGEITAGELESARQAILSSLKGITDSPGSIENFCSVSALSGLPYDLEGYADAVRAVTVRQVAEAAETIRPHTTFFLKGGAQ